MRQRNNGEERSGARRSAQPRLVAVIITALAAVVCASVARGDVIEMSNGDHYSGSVLSVNLTNVTLRSDIQGTVNLPRGKVASIVFGAAKPAMPLGQSKLSDGQRAVPALRVPASTNAVASSNLVGQIQEQLLAGAGPEAVSKYNEMVGNVLSGKLSLADLRKEAQRTLSAVEEAKKDAGPETDDVLEGYLRILRAFVEQSGQQ